ncbi:MAG: GSCFA domain-containing protein [Muribaculaceae bacterium]|nr:GSCFA domain-containing protein [Muribaculaceae bacterium]MDE5930218.1 GSCFA domain-containing protein [Muribaculaceae bacterium]
MKFRTEIEAPRSVHRISHDDGGVMLLGSCFSDNIGLRLEADGFEVCHNPMGPLYNPISLHSFISRLIDGYVYTEADLVYGDDRRWHALDFPLRYSGDNQTELLERINKECSLAADCLSRAATVIVTFGTAWHFIAADSGKTVGNCHKFPASYFVRRRMDSDSIVKLWSPLARRLADSGKHLIATVSPIRHTADGLHGNQLSKATLLLAIDNIPNTEYFPAYEILVDDLRDYRFYDRDLKHPSDMAVEYIYDIFSQTYFSNDTILEARSRFAASLRNAHRPLL